MLIQIDLESPLYFDSCICDLQGNLPELLIYELLCTQNQVDVDTIYINVGNCLKCSATVAAALNQVINGRSKWFFRNHIVDTELYYKLRQCMERVC